MRTIPTIWTMWSKVAIFAASYGKKQITQVQGNEGMAELLRTLIGCCQPAGFRLKRQMEQRLFRERKPDRTGARLRKR